MAVLKALRQTPVALKRNPVVFVPILVLMLFQLPQLLLQAVNPLLASVVSLGISLLFIVLMPFFQGGIIGVADEALDGRTSLGSFVREGRSNYVSLLGVYLAILAVNFAVGIFGTFALVFGGIALFADGAGTGVGTTALAIVGIVVALFVLAYLVFALFVQFYGQAIVVDDLGAVEGIKRSVSVVRGHIVSTLGYSLLVVVFSGLAGGVFALATILVAPQPSAPAAPAAPVALPHLSLAGAAGVTLAVVLLGTIFGGSLGVYSVAFYREITRSVEGSL